MRSRGFGSVYALLLIASGCSQPPENIQGSIAEIRITETGVEVAAVDLTGHSIRAYSRAGSETYVTYEGVGSDDGSFVIEGVPDGSYLLEMGAGNFYQQYYSLDDRDVSFTSRSIGRSDVVLNSAEGTELELRVSGFDPWQSDDDLGFFSFGSGTGFSVGVHAPGNSPGVGATSLNTTIQYDRAALSSEPLVEASLGDVLHLFQSRRVEEFGDSYRTVVSAARNQTLDQQDGQASELVEQLEPIPTYERASLANPFGVLAERLPRTVDPMGVIGQSLVVASPSADEHGLVGFAVVADFRPHPLSATDSIVLDYPNLFPASWLWSYVSLSYAEEITYLGQVYDAPSGISVEAPLEQNPSDYALGPPTQLVFPISVATDDIEIRWQAPERGIPTAYSVQLFLLACRPDGFCRPTPESRFWTFATQIVIPRQLVDTGGYAVQVSAFQYSEAGDPIAVASTVNGPLIVAAGSSSRRPSSYSTTAPRTTVRPNLAPPRRSTFLERLVPSPGAP